jgi:dTDP-4-dehydrorhamnose 3,5-epimerase
MGDKIILSNVSVRRTLRIENQSGDIIRLIRESDPHFSNFGEAYISWVNPDTIKAWKRQNKQTMNLFVPVGSVRFVLIDDSKNSTSIDLKESDDMLLTIPPGIWYGFKCISKTKSMILNIADSIHDPESVDRKPEDFFSFSEYEVVL